MLKNVLKRFSVISGLTGEELSKWSFLCTECLNYVLEHTIKEELSDSQQERCACLAASIAYYKLALYDSDKVSSFTAGDIHISQEQSVLRAEKMMNCEMEQCRDFTDLGGPCFMGVTI
ncbi:MAG: hypothetical protein ACI4G1_04010 [Ruminococcus sp.]